MNLIILTPTGRIAFDADTVRKLLDRHERDAPDIIALPDDWSDAPRGESHGAKVVQP